MPQTLLPLNRRGFLRTAAAGAGWLAARPVYASDADPHRLALLSDTHIPDAPERGDRNCNMTQRLRHVVGELKALEPRPAGVVINGDLAWKLGIQNDYARLAVELAPLRQAGLPLHVTLGNHDDRDNFRAGLRDAQARDRPVDGKHVLVVEFDRADLVLLDSLERKRGVPGELGATQLKWLAAALDSKKDKPALVFAHHNPNWPSAAKAQNNGLTDTIGLWEVLQPRRRVKAFFFGHTHTWRHSERDGIALVNLPAVAYPFKDGEVTGWVDAGLKSNGMTLKLHAIDPKHQAHGQVVELKWRG